MTDKREALFFILHYYKAYPTLQNLGMYFGFSNFAASVCLERLKPCLKAALQAQGIDKNTLFKTQADFDQRFATVTDLVIDISTLDRRILWVSKWYNGSTHDFTIFKDIFAHLTLEKYQVHVDSGFTGIAKFIECKYVFIPFKARKNHPLTTFQKAINQYLASVRVAVENSIAQLKAFFILRIENRMRKKEKLADAFSLCAELACFKQCYASA